jgi:hypothetical protein
MKNFYANVWMELKGEDRRLMRINGTPARLWWSPFAFH